MKEFFNTLLSDLKEQIKNDSLAVKCELAKSKTIWSKIKAGISENPHYYLFLGIVLIGLIQFYICVIVTNGESINESLFYNEEPLSDMFMDYFNPVRSLFMDNPYTQINAMYPPINYLLLSLFTGSIPVENIVHDMQSFSGIDYFSLLTIRGSREAMWSYYSYVFITTLIFIVIVNKILRKNNIKCNVIFDLCLIFSWGFMYMFDRGNFLLIVIDFLLFFFLSEQSSNKVIREIGLISFAVGIDLKIYPVFLSINLLTKKEYSRFIRLAIYCILIFLIPFAFYGGFDAIMAIVVNVFRQSAALASIYPGGNVNFASIINILQLTTGFSNEITSFISKTFPIIIAITCVISCFIYQVKWKRIMILTLALLLYPGATTLYNLVYLFIPLIMFIIEKNKTKFDYVYSVLFAICMIPFPYVIYNTRINLGLYDGNNITWGLLLTSISLITMLFLLVGEALYKIIKVILKRSYKSQDDIAVLYFRDNIKATPVKTSKRFVLILITAYIITSIMLAFIVLLSGRMSNFAAAFCSSMAGLAPSALFIYFSSYMLRAGKITLHTPKVLVGKMLAASGFLMIILAAAISVNVISGIGFSFIAVFRYVLGIVLSISISVITLMLIGVFSKDNVIKPCYAIISSVVFVWLNLVSIAFPSSKINLPNPVHMAARYLYAGASMQGQTGFVSFVYQAIVFIIVGIAGLFMVMCYYVKEYEENTLHHYFSIPVVFKMIKYRDRHNI